VGYNSDLQNLNRNLAIDPLTDITANTPTGFMNDSRQFFVKVSYQFKF